MTPYEIGILLHYYASAVDHPHLELNPPAWRPTIDAFLAMGLLQLNPTAAPVGEARSHYIIAPRGTAYVDALRRVPLPVQEWVVKEST